MFIQYKDIECLHVTEIWGQGCEAGLGFYIKTFIKSPNTNILMIKNILDGRATARFLKGRVSHTRYSRAAP